MKIAVIHQYYLMPGFPGGSRFNEMARYWSEAGHEVTVIAGTVDYNSGKVPRRYRRRWITEERDGNVRVLRCYVPGTYGRSYLGRMLAFFAFTFSAATAVFRLRRPDVVTATSPPLIAAIPGWLAAKVRWRRIPWIFEIRDLWPESAVTTGVLKETAPITRLLYALERWACKRARHIIVLTPAFTDDLIERKLARREEISLIPNGADPRLFQPGPRDNDTRRQFGWGDRFVFMYAGAHGRANALGQLVAAAELLRDREDILIACVGDGPERLKHEAAAGAKGLRNIIFHGPQPKESMPSIVQAADVGMAVLQDNPTFRTIYPNKVFDYMACERPTLLAIDGVARELVCNQAQAGVFTPSEDPESLAATMVEMADDAGHCRELGRRGRIWVSANATRDAMAERYLTLMSKLNRETGLKRGLFAKRLFDICAATLALIVLSPLMLIITLLVRRKLGAPAVFTQERPGLHGKIFTLYKYRTMTNQVDGDGAPLPDEMRMTPFGNFLRRFSLDELPQFWNVLRGDLSLVGPRPFLVEYLELYSKEQNGRHDVKPGITGWAQINGRNAITWDEKFKFDLWYVANRSFGLDLKILWRTARLVSKRRGISYAGQVSMPRFEGSKDLKSEKFKAGSG
ncbi:MAG: glycosyltransferase [bacterium]|nr:glycosyltransferase [bacterium]